MPLSTPGPQADRGKTAGRRRHHGAAWHDGLGERPLHRLEDGGTRVFPTAVREEHRHLRAQLNVGTNSGSSVEDVRCFGLDPRGHDPEISFCFD